MIDDLIRLSAAPTAPCQPFEAIRLQWSGIAGPFLADKTVPTRLDSHGTLYIKAADSNARFALSAHRSRIVDNVKKAAPGAVKKVVFCT